MKTRVSTGIDIKKKFIGLILAIAVCVSPFLQSESEDAMPYIPQIKVGGVDYNLKDERANDLIDGFNKIGKDIPFSQNVSSNYAYVDQNNSVAMVGLSANSFSIHSLLNYTGKIIFVKTERVLSDTYNIVYIITDKNGDVLDSCAINDSLTDVGKFIQVPSNADRIYVNYKTEGSGSKVSAFYPEEKAIEYLNDFALLESSLRKEIAPSQELEDRYVSSGSSGATISTLVGNSMYVYDVEPYAGKTLYVEIEKIKSSTYTTFYILAEGLTVLEEYNDPGVDYIQCVIKVPANANRLYLNFATEGSGAKVYSCDFSGSYEASMDVEDKQILFPSQLFFRSDKETPIFKRSMLQFYGSCVNTDIGLVCNNENTTKRVVDIKEPTNFGGEYGEQVVTGNGRLIASNIAGDTNILYKDCAVYCKDVTEIQSQSVKIMSLGDSLTEGGNWNVTPVTLLASELEDLGISVNYIGSLARNYVNPKTSQTVKINYEGRGGWRYRCLIGRESQFAGIDMVIPSNQTKSEWVEGTDGTMVQIKANNPFLYPARAEDFANYPRHCYHFVSGNTGYNKSYDEDSSLGSYVVFDPTRYFTLRNIQIPDILTIAFGTNEWYTGNFVLEDALDACKFMIEAFRRASSTMKIVVIPANTYPLGRETEWETQGFALTAGVCKIIDDMIRAGDTKLFCCPLYANGGRAFTFSQILSSSNLDSHNDTQFGTTSSNVHILGTDNGENQSYLGAIQYRDGLAACVLNLIP